MDCESWICFARVSFFAGFRRSCLLICFLKSAGNLLKTLTTQFVNCRLLDTGPSAKNLCILTAASMIISSWLPCLQATTNSSATCATSEMTTLSVPPILFKILLRFRDFDLTMELVDRSGYGATTSFATGT